MDPGKEEKPSTTTKKGARSKSPKHGRRSKSSDRIEKRSVITKVPLAEKDDIPDPWPDGDPHSTPPTEKKTKNDTEEKNKKDDPAPRTEKKLKNAPTRTEEKPKKDPSSPKITSKKAVTKSIVVEENTELLSSKDAIRQLKTYYEGILHTFNNEFKSTVATHLYDGYLARAEIDGLLQRSSVPGRKVVGDFLKQDRARLLEAIETLEALASNTDNLKEEAVKIMEPIRYESAHDKKLLELINDDDRMKHITPLTQRAFLLQPNCHRLLDRASQDFGESSATAKKLLKGFYKG